MESAPIQIAGGLTVQVGRGMPVCDRTGADAGVVAAVSIDEARTGPVALVLWMGQSPPRYCLIAARHIASLAGEVVCLSLDRAAIQRLPPRQAT